jgi:RNA polymerase sigma-70 factor (ECF subfamily)
MAAWIRASARVGATLRRVEVNGAPGAEYLDPEGRVIGVMSIEIGGGRIQAVRSVVNPDKLGHLGPLADVNALLRIRRGTEADD